jgi:excisionase family DNA binding protein
MEAPWTVADAASYAGVSSATVIRAAQAGKLRPTRNGRQLHFSPRDVRAWARKRQERRK